MIPKMTLPQPPHLAKGAPCPPKKFGVMRIYSMRYCPFAHRALLVARAKDVPHEIVNVNLSQKPDWIFEKSEGAAVPILETSKTTLSESLIVAEYLQDYIPNRPMFSTDPMKKAKDKIWIQKFEQKVRPFVYKLFMNTKLNRTEIEEAMAGLTDALLLFNKELEARDTKFFAGDSHPGMLDYMMWPFIERLSILRLLHTNITYDIDAAKKKMPTFEKWRQDMKRDDAVKALFLDKVSHLKYVQSSRAGDTKYDF